MVKENPAADGMDKAMGPHKNRLTRIDSRWIVPSQFRLDQVLDLTQPAVRARLAPELAAALAHPAEANRPVLRAFGERLKQTGARGVIAPSWRGSDVLNLVILDSAGEAGPPEK